MIIIVNMKNIYIHIIDKVKIEQFSNVLRFGYLRLMAYRWI